MTNNLSVIWFMNMAASAFGSNKDISLQLETDEQLLTTGYDHFGPKATIKLT